MPVLLLKHCPVSIIFDLLRQFRLMLASVMKITSTLLVLTKSISAFVLLRLLVQMSFMLTMVMSPRRLLWLDMFIGLGSAVEIIHFPTLIVV